MASVCNDCPVIKRCASYGLGQPGGFYAGVWLPWPQAQESTAIKRIREHGRLQLKVITGERKAPKRRKAV
jgi:hypothetical protein